MVSGQKNMGNLKSLSGYEPGSVRTGIADIIYEKIILDSTEQSLCFMDHYFWAGTFPGYKIFSIFSNIFIPVFFYYWCSALCVPARADLYLKEKYNI